MKIAVIGQGVVAEKIATALINNGHHVMIESRTTSNEKIKVWKNNAGNNASAGTFAEAASHGELLFICLNGEYALDAMRTVNADNLAGKIVIDVTNPLDFTQGMPPRIIEKLGKPSIMQAVNMV